MVMASKCAACLCVPLHCNTVRDHASCVICAKDVDHCCCASIHKGMDTDKKTRFAKNMNLTIKDDDCCLDGACDDDPPRGTSALAQKFSGISRFLKSVKGLYAAALGIEILCISAAELGENLGLHIFGFNIVGILIAYVLGYALAGFVTFVTILGRFDYDEKIDSCCSVLGQYAHMGFVPNLRITFKNFAKGCKKITTLHRQKNLKQIFKSSMYILLTAESACILTAETVGIVFYQYSILLAIPLALLVGAFTVVVPHAYKMSKKKP